jgi:WYL domain
MQDHVMPERRISKTRRGVRHARRVSNDGELEWRLAKREPLVAYDDYSDEQIELTVGQKNLHNIEGLVIDFCYIAADGEISRRSVLCWQCGRVADKIYVRGYCPFREALRTFRIDRMSEVIAFLGHKETPIDDVKSFFAAFAAGVAEESEFSFLEASED